MKLELLFFEAVDPSLGRLDYASLPQQALIEMVIYGIKNTKKICGELDEPKDIEEQEGVTIKDGQVVEIDWHFNLKGSLQLEWLPSSVGGFVVGWNFDITGTLNSASFWKHIGGGIIRRMLTEMLTLQPRTPVPSDLQFPSKMQTQVQGATRNLIWSRSEQEADSNCIGNSPDRKCRFLRACV